MKPLVIGVGNPLAGDDGLGYCIGRVLEECVNSKCYDVITLTALDPGVAAYFEGRNLVVVIDAVDPSSLPEGAKLAIYEINPNNMSIEELSEYLSEVSSHEPNPVNIALIARAAGVFRGRFILLGVRAFNIELGAGLSSEACKLVSRAVANVLEIVGCKASVDNSCCKRILVRECGCTHV